MYEVRNHRLYKDGEPVKFMESHNQGGALTPNLIVVHYTGDMGQGGLNWLIESSPPVSAHLWISRTGEVIQLVPFNRVAWHAGASSYNGRNGCNSFSIGIENQGVGKDWPDAQIEANKGVIEALYRAYPIDDTVGHEDVAPGRKSDPGPNYPWRKVFPGWEE